MARSRNQAADDISKELQQQPQPQQRPDRNEPIEKEHAASGESCNNVSACLHLSPPSGTSPSSPATLQPSSTPQPTAYQHKRNGSISRTFGHHRSASTASTSSAIAAGIATSTPIATDTTSPPAIDKNSIVKIIEERVAHVYYQHGLLCSRHPLYVIIFSILTVLVISSPLFTVLTSFGSSFEIFRTHAKVSSQLNDPNISPEQWKIQFSELNETNNFREKMFNYFWKEHMFDDNEDDFHHEIPRWFQPNLSQAFVQQIFIRSAVIPWEENKLHLVDALKGPLEVAFELIEAISNYQLKSNDFENINLNLNDICLQVYEPIIEKQYSHLFTHFPSYSCLMLSPTNLWKGDVAQFLQDRDFLSTLLKFQDTTSPLPFGALHNIFFGVNFEETGIRRSYTRSRTRVITFAITLIFRQYNPSFMEGLRKHLINRHPLSDVYYNRNNSFYKDIFPGESSTIADEMAQVLNETIHIYFQHTFTRSYLIPLVISYTIVCLFMFFSVRKTELVRNKFLYSLGGLITVLMSVTMSFGICTRLGLNSPLIVNRLLPYFVAAVSFENMFVMTKSVVANPHLDAKVRVAQGLSKEGLSITKNLLAEVTLLTIGSLTFMPFFQECCIFAAVCILSDFFIQITFFTSIFSLNIERLSHKSQTLLNSNLYLFPRSVFALPNKPTKHTTPKRLRFVIFLANTRMVQRGLILLLCACIGIAIYNAYQVLDQQPSVNEFNVNLKVPTSKLSMLKRAHRTAQRFTPMNRKVFEKAQKSFHRTVTKSTESKESLAKEEQRSLLEFLKTPSMENISNLTLSDTDGSQLYHPYRRIIFTSHHLSMLISPSNYHWSNIFSLYNISLVGRFVSILPPILLSIPISPEKAVNLRNMADMSEDTFKKFIHKKIDGPKNFVDDDIDEFDFASQHFFSSWSRMDIYITIALSIPSLVFIVYMCILLYRCVCTRNYAEWRTDLSTKFNASFLEAIFKSSYDLSTKIFQFDITMLNVCEEEEVYINENQFMLHNQDIDRIAANVNTSLVATASMSGDIRIYDALACEPLAYIQRSKFNGSNPGEALSGNGDQTVNIGSNTGTSPTVPRNSTALLAKTSGNILKAIVDGVSVDSCNDIDDFDGAYDGEEEEDSPFKDMSFEPIWCLDIFDHYILAGCGGDGRLELWDTKTGRLESVHGCEMGGVGGGGQTKISHQFGITAMKVAYWGVAIARMNGMLDLLEIEQNYDYRMHKVHRMNNEQHSPESRTKRAITLRLRHRTSLHKQPIIRLEIIESLDDEDFFKIFGSKGCLITGCLDGTLKVLSLGSAQVLYSLNGHCGGVVVTSVDQYSTATALSGCQLGQLCVWDLNTGTCIFSMQAHFQCEILAITASPLYYVSSATDNRICVWDRFSGHLVHSINQQEHGSCRSMLFLDSYILITVRDYVLVIWDVNDAKQLCFVSLVASKSEHDEKKVGNKMRNYEYASIKSIAFTYERSSLVCDYGNSLCVIKNPFGMKKMD